MIEILITKEFEDRYARLPKKIQIKAEKQEMLFCRNPFHPSLHTEKLEPREKQVWSFRIDKRGRFVFLFYGAGRVLLVTVGPHDWIYRIQW